MRFYNIPTVTKNLISLNSTLIKKDVYVYIGHYSKFHFVDLYKLEDNEKTIYKYATITFDSYMHQTKISIRDLEYEIDYLQGKEAKIGSDVPSRLDIIIYPESAIKKLK